MRDDIRSALRSLRATPGAALLAWVVLAAAMAAAIVTFAVVDTVVLRRLPFDGGDRLVAIGRIGDRARAAAISGQDYLASRDLTDTFESVAGISLRNATMRAADAAPIPASAVVGDLFGTLHARPFMGGPLQLDYAAGQDRVVVLSYGAWQRRFGASPDIVGTTIAFSDGPRQVIGVMPPGFEYPVGLAQPVEIFDPYVMRANERQYGFGGRGYMFDTVARLRDGITVDQARQSRLRQTMDALTVQYPAFETTTYLDVASLSESMAGRTRGWMLIALFAVSLVLVTACLNVASLLLARVTTRSREFAVRAALGESSGRRVRTVLIESLTLATAAAAAGLLIAWWVLTTVKSALPETIARVTAIAIDARVLVAAAVAVIATALLFGVLPAWRAARVDLTRGLQANAGTRVTGRRRFREALLVTEIAFVTAALVVATFFIVSFVRVVRKDIGFDRASVVFASVSVPGARTEAEGAAVESKGFALLTDLTTRLLALPGVERVGISNGGVPLIGNMARYTIHVPGRTDDFEGADMALYRSVSADYFTTIGMRLERGRFFDAREDAPGAAPVAILNATAAKRYLPNGDAIGSAVDMYQRARTIVGIVDDVRVLGPEDDVRPELYLPLREDPTGQAYVSVKTAGSPAPLIPAIQAAIRSVIPGNTPPRVFSMEDIFRRLTLDRRVAAGFMSAFGLLALAIGAAGIYAVMSFVVAQRTRDIGVRMALGASGRRVHGEVIRDAARHVVIGATIGLVAAWLASGLIAAFLFDVKTSDWSVYAIVIAILTTVGLVAALLPARRASRVDPLIALRAE